MKRPYDLWRLSDLIKHCNEVSVCINEEYVPARPIPFGGMQRIKLAWMVLRNTADAFTWPEQDYLVEV